MRKVKKLNDAKPLKIERDFNKALESFLAERKDHLGSKARKRVGRFAKKKEEQNSHWSS